MFPKSAYNSFVVLSLLLSLTGCLATVQDIRPLPPEKLPAIQNPLSPVTESTISVPVQIDFSTFLNQVNDEHVIPKKFDSWGSSIKNPKGAEYKYYVERDDFLMAPSGSYSSTNNAQGSVLRDWWKGIDLPGSSVPISTALRYKIGAHPHGHCGDGNEWPRRATLTGNIGMGMTPSYGLSAAVKSVVVNTVDPCDLGNAETDVMQEVKTRLTHSVREGLNHAVGRINAITLKPQVEEAWNALRKPMQVGPDSWLQLNIDKIRHAGFSGGGHTADDTLQISARPVIVAGTEPLSAPAALPQLDTQPAPSGFHVITDTPLDYAELSKSLTNRLKGRRVERDGNFIAIMNAWIYGNGGNQVVMRIDIAGDATGHVYLVGKPDMNALTQTVYISDLQYDRATANLLQTKAAWLYRTTLRELIASEAVMGVTPATDRLREVLTKALNRTVSPTVSMQGTIQTVQGISVFADVNALHVRTMSDGTLTITATGKP
jgi:Domain of unknown function (DUF4403)